MRTIVLAAATAATLSLGAVTANAAPLIVAAPAAGAPIVLVAGGCGPAFHRGPYGRCFANGVVRRILPLYRGVCVRRWTAFGWRRVCR